MSPCTDQTILEIMDLTRTVSIETEPVNIVDSISFEFKKGGIYNIVGPSGAGKSSLLRLINRLDEATFGRILFDQTSIIEIEPTLLRQKIALMFQTPYLFDSTVKDNLEYACPEKNEADFIEILSMVGLPEKMLDKNVGGLSVGEMQRVSLARAVSLEPDILLLDEPTSALDPSNSKKIEELILSLSAKLCLTIIIVTHNPEQALRLGGETLLLSKGKLIESGKTTKVLTSPMTLIGQKYLNKELL